MWSTLTPSACASRNGGEMAGRADAGMRHLAPAVRLHPGDQLRQRVGGERLAPDQHQRVGVDHGDRHEVLLGVERQRLVERHVGRDLQIVDEQRVAVGRRARDARAGDVGAAAADVLDDEILPELGRELRRDLARDLVGRPAGRVGHDDGDRPRRIGLRVGHASRGDGSSSDGEQDAFSFHPPDPKLAFVAGTIAHGGRSAGPGWRVPAIPQKAGPRGNRSRTPR